MTPGLSKDIQCHVRPWSICYACKSSRADIRLQVKWSVSLVIADGNFLIFLDDLCEFVWVNIINTVWHIQISSLMLWEVVNSSVVFYLHNFFFCIYIIFHCTKNTIHQLTTMLATSKNVLFPASHRYWWPDTLIIARAPASEGSSVSVVSRVRVVMTWK